MEGIVRSGIRRVIHGMISILGVVKRIVGGILLGVEGVMCRVLFCVEYLFCGVKPLMKRHVFGFLRRMELLMRRIEVGVELGMVGVRLGMKRLMHCRLLSVEGSFLSRKSSIEGGVLSRLRPGEVGKGVG